LSNERLAMLLFDIGLVLAMISMVIGPFEITSWALTTGVVAGFFGIASLCLGFLCWDEWMKPEQRTSDHSRDEVAPGAADGLSDSELHQKSPQG